MADSGQSYMQDPNNLPGMAGPNLYSSFNGIPLQFDMPGYRGDATDASGNPIASWTAAKSAADKKYADDMAAYNAQLAATPGTTINSTPAAATQAAPAGVAANGAMGPISMDKSMTGPQFNDWVKNDPNGQAYAARGQGIANAGIYERAAGSQLSTGGFGTGNGNPDMYRAMLTNAGQSYDAAQQPQSQQPTAAAAAPTPPTYPDLRQAYLDALANPGHVTTPGATMTGSPTGPAGGDAGDVLTSFLANFKGSGGGGVNQSFMDQMKQLNAGKGTA